MWVRIPVELGEALWSHVLAKGAGHKYIKRVPYTKKNGKKGYRYYYKVQHGGGVHHEDHFEEGAAFRYQGGHYHITSVDGDTLTVRHDETGKVQKVSRSRLRALLGTEHAKEISAYRSRLREDLEAAQKYGSPKQLARLLQQADKWGVSTALQLTDSPSDAVKGALDEIAPALGESAKTQGSYTKPQLEALAIFGRLARSIADSVDQSKQIEQEVSSPAGKRKTARQISEAKKVAEREIDSDEVIHEEVGTHVFGARRDLATSARRRRSRTETVSGNKKDILGEFTLTDHIANGGTVGAWHLKNWIVGRVSAKAPKDRVDDYRTAVTVIAKTLDNCRTVQDVGKAVHELAANWGTVKVMDDDTYSSGWVKTGGKERAQELKRQHALKVAALEKLQQGRLSAISELKGVEPEKFIAQLEHEVNTFPWALSVPEGYVKSGTSVEMYGGKAIFSAVYSDPAVTEQKTSLGKGFNKWLDSTQTYKQSAAWKRVCAEARKLDKQNTSVADYIARHAKSRGRKFVIGQVRTVAESERTGGKHIDGITQGRVTGEQVLDHFALKNIDYGNWATNAERNTHLVDAGRALTDLADILNVSPADIGRNGQLAIGFGSRGSGNASAHYEPGAKVINLTKFVGGGSLAHEWGHYLDNVVAPGDHAYASNAGAWKSFPADSKSAQALKELQEAVNVSDFKRHARALDEGKRRAYWSTSEEMFARLFETWASDELASRGRKSTYLVHGTDQKVFTGVEVNAVADTQVHSSEELASFRQKRDSAEKELRAAIHAALPTYAPRARPAMSWLGVSDNVLTKLLRQSKDVKEKYDAYWRAAGARTTAARKKLKDAGTVQAQPYPHGEDRKALVAAVGRVMKAFKQEGHLVGSKAIMKAGTYKVPSAVSAAARRGLEYRRRAGGKGGLTVAQASAQRYWDGYFTPRPGIDIIIKADDRPTGGGWQPIPGGKHGGYRKKAGKGYTYWYPSSAHAAKAAKHHKKKGERMRKRLERVLRKRGAKQSDIEKFLDQYDHHSGAGHGAHTMSRSGDEEAKTEETGKEETKTEGASDKSRGNLLQALKDHHGLSDEQAEEVAARLDTEQKKRKSKSALESALKEHHGLSDEQVGQVMKQLGTMLANRKEEPKKEEPKKKAPKKKAPKKKAPKKDADQGPQDQKKEDGARGSVSVYQGHSEDNKELLEHIQAEQQKHQLTTAEVESVLKRLRKEGAATKQDISDAFESWKPLSLPDGYEGVLKQVRIDRRGKKVRDEARRNIRSAKNRAAAKRAKMSPKQRAKADAKKKKNDERFKLKYERVQDPLRQVNPKDVKAQPSVVRALSGQSSVRETQREYIKLAEHATKEAEKAGMSHKELAGVLKQFKGKKETTAQQITAAIRGERTSR